MSSSPIQSIAILGMACRFPGADSPDAFWRNLAAGVASVQETPASRWPIEQLFAPPPYQPGKSISKWGAFLDDIQRFDAAFFNIPAAEAQVMDPQQRILLELAYETLERNGYDPRRRAGLRIGVFLGVGQNGYSELTVPLLRSGQPTHPMLVTHNIRNLVAGQIAHSLNLTGPALVIDTACSSSLVALHLARQSLLAGDCDLALVGGINLNITATPFVAFSSAGVLSASAHTHVFDERADGFVLGEGGGMLLLGLLDYATAAGDPVLGVIKGSAINNDGRSLGVITPSPGGQEAVLRAAYATAGIDPITVTYIEAHGTGTRIGDVVEARALTRFFSQPPANGVRYLGSAKPNVGHLLSAAGMPSLIKVLLAFQHRQLPPTLDSEQMRPLLKLDRAGFAINQTLVEWLPAAPDQPLRAGVSGFGFGGTNAHIILEEVPPLGAKTAQQGRPTTYTFAHTPFWVDTLSAPPMPLLTPASSRVPAPSIHELSEADATVDTWLQQVVWQAEPLPPNQATMPYRDWVILTIATSSAHSLAHALIEDLQAQGCRCAHQDWAAGATLDTRLVPTDQPWGLILLGPVEPPTTLDSRAALDSGLEQGLFALHTLVHQVLAMASAQRPAGLWVITVGAHAVDEADCIAPERAALTGLAFALGDEMADPPCLVVDLPPTCDPATQCKILMEELRVSARRNIVAWRSVDKQWLRLVRRLESVHAITTKAHFSLSRTGAYLITGGATGIGAALARSLAAYGVPLILTGRTPITRDPPRAALVTELRKQGATVEYVVADVTQADEVTTLFDYVCALYGAPVGVIHAAGIVRPQPLRSKTQADFQAVLEPKVIGAWLLAQEMQRRAIHPDCFVLFSSIASLLPGFSGGLSDYTAANAFLDALATAERARGVACTVLNWSVWAETGMGAQPLLLQWLATQGLAGLTSAEGVRAFYRALALDKAQVVILKPSTAAVTMPARSVPGAVPQSTTTKSLTTTRSSPEIEALLQALLATVLKVEPTEVSKTASFMSLGIDSMDALDLVLKLESAGFGGLPATLFFEYQTIIDLAHYLATQASNTQTVNATDATQDSTLIIDSTNHPITNHLIPNHPITCPLSPIQRAFAITHHLYPERPAVAFLRQTVLGTLDLALLQQTVAIIATRHPLLRARFPATQITAPQPQQTICPPDSPGIIPVIELITGSVNGAAEVAHLETALINRPFDLDEGSPWRITLAADQGQTNHWHLLLAIHHIAGDAWSLSLVAQELWIVYTNLVQGESTDLPAPQNTFQEVVADQQQRAGLESKTQAWWRRQLTQYAPALPLRLPFDRDPDRLTPEGWTQTRQAAHASRLTPATTAALIQLAAAHELSLFHLVLAAYLRCLRRWSNLPYLIVNVADAQRPTHLPGVMEIVGSFADTLPLGLAMQPDESALELGERIRHAWLAIQQAKAVSSLDLARLLAEVAPAGGSDQPRMVSPLGFSFVRFAATLPVDCPIQIVDIFGRTATAALRLSLVGWEFAGALHFSWNYLAPLFSAATIAKLADRFVNELEQLVAHDSEVGQDLSGFEKPDRSFMSVHALVQAQCQRTPAEVAVWEQGETLTYGELDRRSDQVAGALYALGVKVGDTVGLLAQPSTAAIVLLLGIAKAGATWVPLDPDHPPARHANQLQQAATQVVLFPTPLAAKAHAISAAMAGAVQLYPLDNLYQVATSTLPTATLSPAALAYIIFTSGSTGRPKGVPITHGALANYIGWAIETFGYGPNDRVMQATSLCFDASIRQILAPLVTGGTVVPIARALVNDPHELLALIQQAQITIWSSVPALWGRLLAAIEMIVANGAPTPNLSHLRWIQVGGEALAAQLVRRWFDLYGDQQQLVNLYGPTETTINATYYLVKARPADDVVQIPIGYPVRGAQIQVLDAAGQPCPPGTPGELYIGGIGLSPGYLHDSVRTQEQFIYDSRGQRFYRSGDRAQWRLPFRREQHGDGALLFLGRMDDQVKVRGYRIELGEIEGTLCQHPAIRLAAVIVRQPNPDEQVLVAYLECHAPSPDEAALRQWLHLRLPAYMLPHHLYQLSRLPLTTNGKIDRHRLASGLVESLPLPHQPSGDTPKTPTEQLLARLWQKVLRLDATTPIRREDDFFALGGDSLQAIQLFVELGKECSELPRAAYLYRYRTLTALAQALDDYRPEPKTPQLSTNTATDHFAVSLAQAGFLLLRALQADQTTSWCARFCLTGPLHVDAFTQAVQLLVTRHPMLRTIFPPLERNDDRSGAGRTPSQRILSPDRVLPVTFTDWQALTEVEQQLAIEGYWNTLRARRFDPSQWPLIEMHLCRLAPDHHLWFVATDHLIGDGFSGWLLGQELLQIHDALVKGQAPLLPPLRSTFRDYVILQQQHEQSHDPAAEAHWRGLFATPYQPPNLGNRQKTTSPPARQGSPDPGSQCRDLAIPGEQKREGWTNQPLDCEPALVQQIERYAGRIGVTPYELLLTLFCRQLQRLTGQADLVIGSAVAGRDEPLPDILRIFGAFATALPLRVQLADTPWQTQVKQVAAAFGAARAHTLSPRRIAQLMHPQTPLTAAVGAQFLFSYMDFSALGELESDTLRVDWARSQTELQPPTLSGDLVLTGRKVEGRLRLVFAAPTAALSQETLQAFVETFRHDLHQQIAPPALHFTSIPLEKGPNNGQPVLPLDAALIAYLPPLAQIQATLGPAGAKVNADALRRLLFPEGSARWLERLETRLGHSGTIFIPWFADELGTARPDDLHRAVLQAINQATKLGAQVVSLAGMLPAHTRYGYALLDNSQTTSQELSGLRKADSSAPVLTTGHSTTVVAVVKSVLAALAATGQSLATKQIGCLGLGSIGSAALQLLLKVAGHPAGLTLCDVEGSGARLRALVATLRRELDYQGNVRIIEVADRVNDTVPDELYTVDLIIGATSRPNLLDIDRLTPGTVVVDDSFPACFEVERAIVRMTTARDVLLVGGGLLDCGPIQRTIHLPLVNPDIGKHIAGQLLTDAVASCQLEALLWAGQPTLLLTQGVATLQGALAYWNAAATVGIAAAPLHLREFRIEESLLRNIRDIIAKQ